VRAGAAAVCVISAIAAAPDMAAAAGALARAVADAERART
jgi:thiamine monophosphate synthase